MENTDFLLETVRRHCAEFNAARSPNRPIYPDAINVISKQPLTWPDGAGHKVAISNFSCHQNHLRVLEALSLLTGEEQWVEQATQAIAWMFESGTDRNGLFYWGAHVAVCHRTGRPFQVCGKSFVHEIKGVYPHYDLIKRVDERAFNRYLGALWNAHCICTRPLVINRHGGYDRMYRDPLRWEVSVAPALMESWGLPFVTTGSDLVWGAMHTGDGSGALPWRKLSSVLAASYAQAAHPETGIKPYQYTLAAAREAPTSDRDVRSRCGDRARRQFGPEWGQDICEAYVIDRVRAEAIYGGDVNSHLEMVRKMGMVQPWLVSAVGALETFAHHAFDFVRGGWKPILADGTSIELRPFPRDGYYGSRGTVLKLYRSARMILPYVNGAIIGRSALCWKVLKRQLSGFGVGDIGAEPGDRPNLAITGSVFASELIFALLDLFHATGFQEYRDCANDIVKRWVRPGSANPFVASGAPYASIDSPMPLAFLLLYAANHRHSIALRYIGGRGETHGIIDDTAGRTELRFSRLGAPAS